VSTPDWIYVLDESKLPDNVMTVVFPFGIPVLLVKTAGSIYAVSNKCAHMGCTLSRGSLGGFIVECPCHEWTFDIRTGAFVTANEIKIPTYECKAENGKVFVKVREAAR
jgi:nitrite reductase/ring-hydroxylating ferredoxin subunit